MVTHHSPLDLPLNLAGTEAIYPRALAHSAAKTIGAIEENWSRYELMRGHPGHEPPLVNSPVTVRQKYAVLDALFADGDSARGRAAGDALDITRPAAPAGDQDQVSARFAAGQYSVATRRADRTPGDRGSPDGSGRFPQPLAVDLPRAYALLLEARWPPLHAAPNRGTPARVDSALADPVWVPWASYGNLIAARLHEERGEIAAALAAVRRRRRHGVVPSLREVLREEGRLAALTGDRQGAIRAYRHISPCAAALSPGYSRKCGGCVGARGGRAESADR